MFYYGFIDNQSGEIFSHGSTSSQSLAELQKPPIGQSLITSQDIIRPEKHYVLNNNVTDRPEINLPLIMEISEPCDILLPIDTDVFLDDINLGTCEDGHLLLQAEMPGSYVLRFMPPFPYLNHLMEVSVI